MKNRAFVVRFAAYNDKPLRVIFSGNVERTGRRLGVDLRDAVAAYLPGEFRKAAPSYLIFDLAPDEGTIAHEAAHAIRALFSHVGVRLDDENFAYHLDYLVGRIHKFIKRRA